MNQIAYSKGWYDRERSPLEVAALIHSEVSEAVEAWREDDIAQVAEELADVIIRILDTAWYEGIDLDEAFHKKVAKNRERPYRHGGKLY